MSLNFKRAVIITLSLLSVFSLSAGIASLDEESAKIVAGDNKVFSTRMPTRVAIGNPNIADVVDVTEAEITVTAKAAGNTTLVYWDAYGEQSVNIKVIPEDTQAFKQRIDSLLARLNFPEVYSKVAEEEGKVMLLGKVKLAKDKERIATALGPLKDKYIDLIEVKEEEAVIEIDVQILELQKGYEKNLGFTWPTQTTLTEVGTAGIAAVGTNWGSLWRMANASRNAYQMVINTLEKEGKARILSRPRLACQSGKEAKLLVGGEVPILSTSVSSGGTTSATGAAQPGNVDYKEYGIIMKINPAMIDDNRVHINLTVEVSELGTVVSTSYALAYPLIKRNASTELYLDDGETMAIGGLIKQKSEEDLQKFPWLADVPVLGAFFRNRSTKTGGGSASRGDSELFITLTPRIVSRGREPALAKSETESKSVGLAGSTSSSSPMNNYANIVQKRILHNLKYPALAKSTGFQGTVILKLHLSYLGELLDVSVKESSGYQILDEQTLKIAKGIAFYPPFPPAIEAKDTWLEIPVEYRLE